MSARRDVSVPAKIFRSLGIGTGVGMIVCFLILLVTAAVMTTGVIPPTAVTPVAMAVAAVSAFVGGWVTARISRERGLLYGAASGLVLCLLIVLVGIVVLQEVRGSLLLIKFALTIGFGALGGVFGVNTKKR